MLRASLVVIARSPSIVTVAFVDENTIRWLRWRAKIKFPRVIRFDRITQSPRLSVVGRVTQNVG